MIELTYAQFSLALPLFRSTAFGALAAGILSGTQPGRVFVDDLADPSIGLVRPRIEYSFLAGAPTQASIDWLYDTIEQDFLPRQKAELNSPEVVLFYDPPAWEPMLFERFAARKPLRIHKKRHMLPNVPEHAAPPALPDGLRLVPYQLDWLTTQPALCEELSLFYGTLENFLEHSLGLAVLDGSRLACACHAVFTTPAQADTPGEAEISIHTSEVYRRRGLAEITARAFIQTSLARNLCPVWGCWPENLPSMQLARKLGFIEEVDQPALFFIAE